MSNGLRIVVRLALSRECQAIYGHGKGAARSADEAVIYKLMSFGFIGADTEGSTKKEHWCGLMFGPLNDVHTWLK